MQSLDTVSPVIFSHIPDESVSKLSLMSKTVEDEYPHIQDIPLYWKRHLEIFLNSKLKNRPNVNWKKMFDMITKLRVYSPIVDAVKLNDIDVISILIEAGFDPRIDDNLALRMTDEYSNIDLRKLLSYLRTDPLLDGREFKAISDFPYNPLYWKEHLEVFLHSKLKDRPNADWRKIYEIINKLNIFSPIVDAVKFNNAELIDILIEAGFDPRIDYNLALRQTDEYTNKHVVSLLVNSITDPSLNNRRFKFVLGEPY